MAPRVPVEQPHVLRPTSLATLTGVRLVLTTLEAMSYPFLPTIARGLGVTVAQAGLLFSARAIGALAAPLAVRWFATGPGPLRRQATVGMLGSGAGALVLVAGGWARGDLLGFVAGGLGFALVGFARAAYDVASQSELSARSSYARRARVLSVYELPFAGASLVGVPAVGLLVALGDWRTPYLAIAAVLALLVPVVRHAHDGAGEPAVATTRDTTRHVLPPDGLALLVHMGLLALAMELALVAQGSWLEDVFGLGAVALGTLATVLGGAGVVGELVPLVAADRVGKRRTVLFGLATAALGATALATTTTSLPLGMAALGLAFLGFEVAIVASFPLASEVLPRARAFVLSRVVVALSAGRVVGDVVGPWLYERTGMPGNAGVAAAVFVLALLVVVTRVPDDRGGAVPGG